MKKKNIFLVLSIIAACLTILFSYLFAKISDNEGEPLDEQDLEKPDYKQPDDKQPDDKPAGEPAVEKEV